MDIILSSVLFVENIFSQTVCFLTLLIEFCTTDKILHCNMVIMSYKSPTLASKAGNVERGPVSGCYSLRPTEKWKQL